MIKLGDAAFVGDLFLGEGPGDFCCTFAFRFFFGVEGAGAAFSSFLTTRRSSACMYKVLCGGGFVAILEERRDMAFLVCIS